MSQSFNCQLFDIPYDDKCYKYCYNGPNYLIHNNEIDIERREDEQGPIVFEIGIYVPICTGDNVYYEPDEGPTTSTIGNKGDKAVNLYDMKSWTLQQIELQIPVLYHWVEDDEFSPRDNGHTVVPVSSHYYADKTYDITFYNSRYETLYTNTFAAASPFVFELDDDLQKMFRKGIYRYRIDMVDAGGKRTRMADPSESAILVN